MDSRPRLSGGPKLRSVFGHSCPPFPKKTSMEDGRPARPGSSTGPLPNSPPATPNHVGVDASAAQPSAAPQLMGLSSRTGLICEVRACPERSRRGIWARRASLALFARQEAPVPRAFNLEEEPCQSRPQLSAHKPPKPLQKHGKSGVTTPTTNLLKMVFCNCAYIPLAGIRM